MRAVVLCADPDSAESEPGSAWSVLADLGCRVSGARLDLSDLDRADIEEYPPTIVVVDAPEHVTLGKSARTLLSNCELLAEVPTLLVTTQERLSAMEFSRGFDDFILAPILPTELYARIRQLDWRSAAFGSDDGIKIGALHIDVAGHEVHLGGKRIAFAPQEFELLRYLAQHRGRVFTREQLLQRVWGYDYDGGPRTVDIHVRRVRAKLAGSSGASSLIATVRNVGYKMR